MTLEEAVELLLSGEGRVSCSGCFAHGGLVTDSGEIAICEICEGWGDLFEEELAQAHELLGLPSPKGRSFTDAYGPSYDP